ncbi:nucleotidyl transferase AbiEii/AbiGii toxin family protein [Corynebacterium sp. P5848]|uniref:nucleotidyl transferase AbiEii/AbiGii toxin family protein n=1 Tax=Corynebacterium marambiense TaxID=2765364 RepID=UPI0022608F6B|nr:nucleotidyl transferase AbiEii/AbiGii toxin family protein [Corynebacterium marambiense]MCX7543591.1 nucleotidyl transferase AbiEii/AbiGii toxin family protein [Corynebacterium marambiense]
MDRLLAEQRTITRLCLEVAADNGFVLAGAGALREHGITNRPTEDVDLFSVMDKIDSFGESIAAIEQQLTKHGYTVEHGRTTPTFAHMDIATPYGRIGLDAGLDWRANDPVHLQLGPVLDIEDVVASKLIALEGRRTSRDYLDVDAILRSGRFTGEQLLTMAENRDSGFNREFFSQALRDTTWQELSTEEMEMYELDGAYLDAVTHNLTAWADQIDNPHQGNTSLLTVLYDDHTTWTPNKTTSATRDTTSTQPSAPVNEDSSEQQL